MQEIQRSSMLDLDDKHLSMKSQNFLNEKNYQLLKRIWSPIWWNCHFLKEDKPNLKAQKKIRCAPVSKKLIEAWQNWNKRKYTTWTDGALLGSSLICNVSVLHSDRVYME